MNDQAVRIAISAPEAWDTLTDAQRAAVTEFLRCRTVAGTARALGISRQSVLERLAGAGKKFLAFARAIEDAGAA